MALAGVARLVAEETSDEYLASLWKAQIEEQPDGAGGNQIRLTRDLHGGLPHGHGHQLVVEWHGCHCKKESWSLSMHMLRMLR